MAKRLSAAFAWWNHRLPSAGTLAMAAFILAVVSGVLLALPFDVGDPADSVELLEIASPAARLLRAAHGWAGNLLVILTLLHAVEHLLSGTETALARGVWLRVVLLIPVLLLVMITGFILKGDSEGRLAMQIVAGLIGRIPWIGGDVAVSLLGTDEDLQLAYVHHAATLTLVAWILVVEHARRLWPSAGAALAVTIAVLVAATAAVVLRRSPGGPPLDRQARLDLAPDLGGAPPPRRPPEPPRGGATPRQAAPGGATPRVLPPHRLDPRLQRRRMESDLALRLGGAHREPCRRTGPVSPRAGAVDDGGRRQRR